MNFFRNILLLSLGAQAIATPPPMVVRGASPARGVVSTNSRTSDFNVEPDVSLLRWTPPESQAPANDISVALIKSANKGNKFNDKLGADIESALIARGYKVSRFSNYNEMTYNDKKSVDLVLFVEPSVAIAWLELPTTIGRPLPSWDDPRAQDIKPLMPQKVKHNLFSQELVPDGHPMMWQGKMGLAGAVAISIRPSTTFQEVLFRKNIELPQVEPETVVGTKATGAFVKNASDLLRITVASDPASGAACNRLIGKIYSNIVDDVYKYLDPAELKPLKAQAEEIRSKKSY